MGLPVMLEMLRILECGEMMSQCLFLKLYCLTKSVCNGFFPINDMVLLYNKCRMTKLKIKYL